MYTSTPKVYTCFIKYRNPLKVGKFKILTQSTGLSSTLKSLLLTCVCVCSYCTCENLMARTLMIFTLEDYMLLCDFRITLCTYSASHTLSSTRVMTLIWDQKNSHFQQFNSLSHQSKTWSFSSRPVLQVQHWLCLIASGSLSISMAYTYQEKFHSGMHSCVSCWQVASKGHCSAHACDMYHHQQYVKQETCWQFCYVHFSFLECICTT